MTIENDTTQPQALTFADYSKDKLLLLQVDIALARVLKHGEDVSILKDAISNVFKQNEALGKENGILRGCLLELLAK